MVEDEATHIGPAAIFPCVQLPTTPCAAFNRSRTTNNDCRECGQWQPSSYMFNLQELLSLSSGLYLTDLEPPGTNCLHWIYRVRPRDKTKWLTSWASKPLFVQLHKAAIKLPHDSLIVFNFVSLISKILSIFIHFAHIRVTKMLYIW